MHEADVPHLGGLDANVLIKLRMRQWKLNSLFDLYDLLF